MSNEGYHEPIAELTDKTRDLHGFYPVFTDGFKTTENF